MKWIVLMLMWVGVAYGDTAFIGSKWLARVSDERRLSELTIPGAHNAGSVGVALAAGRCQSVGVRALLDAGVRVLDIRVDGEGQVRHGILRAGVSFAEVMGDVVAFLQAHPREFVIVSLKDEQYRGDEATWTEKIVAVLDSKPIKPFGLNGMPSQDFTVGVLRGKFLVLRRYGLLQGRGLEPTSWGDNRVSIGHHGAPLMNIQDVYALGDTKAKWTLVEDFLKRSAATADDGRLWINFTSLAYRLFQGTPWDYAKALNPKLEMWLKNAPQGRYGFVMLDFATFPEGLLEALISKNAMAPQCP